MRGENNGGRFGFGEIAERAEYCGYMARGCGNLGADLPRKRGLKPGFCSVGQYDANFCRQVCSSPASTRSIF